MRPQRPPIKRYKPLGTTDIPHVGHQLRRLAAAVVTLIWFATPWTRASTTSIRPRAIPAAAPKRLSERRSRGKRDQVYIVSKASFGSARAAGADDACLGRKPAGRVAHRLRRCLFPSRRERRGAHSESRVPRLYPNRPGNREKIRYVGLSGHGGRLIECLDYAIDSGKFDVMLVAYNFGQDPSFVQKLTRNFDFIAVNPDLPRVLRKAKAAGMGVVAMKTLRGAKLNDMQPYQKDGATFSQAAFRWVLSNADVDGLIVTMPVARRHRRVPRRFRRHQGDRGATWTCSVAT